MDIYYNYGKDEEGSKDAKTVFGFVTLLNLDFSNRDLRDLKCLTKAPSGKIK